MADGAAIHGKWDGTGCTGIARCLLPAIWTRYPRTSSLLRQLQLHFPIYHALDCKWGSLVTERHNELRDRVADLDGRTFTPSLVCDNTLIFTGCYVKRPKSKPDSSKATTVPSATTPLESMEQKVDLLIHDLCQNGTNSAHNMRVVTTYAKSHSANTPENCLHEAERAKKNMYLVVCLQQH